MKSSGIFSTHHSKLKGKGAVFMRKSEELAWRIFEKTGGVKAYMKYRALSKGTELEAGEELGTVKDRGNCHKNNKIQ